MASLETNIGGELRSGVAKFLKNFTLSGLITVLSFLAGWGTDSLLEANDVNDGASSIAGLTAGLVTLGISLAVLQGSKHRINGML